MASRLEIIISAINKASGPIGEVGKSLDSLDGKAQKAKSALKPVNDLIGSGLKAAVGVGVGALAALGVGLRKSIGLAMDMEQGVANIASIMGLARDEVSPLKDLITQLGLDPNLVVTATEAASAIEMLAKNGLPLEDILGGAARSSILLSNATGADFATSADVATDAMALFGLKADQMEKAVAGIVAVTQQSKFGVEEYKYALANAAPVLSRMGVSFDEFNAAITLSASSFASGMTAGTSWRYLIQNLVPATDKAGDAMKELGLITTDFTAASEWLSEVLLDKVEPTYESVRKGLEAYVVGTGLAEDGSAAMEKKVTALMKQFDTNAFFDANGQLKDMDEIVRLLQGAFNGLGVEQQQSFARTIFGQEALGALGAAMGMNIDLLNETIATQSDVNKLNESAATRTDTLQGALGILSGQFEAVGQMIGDKFLPHLTTLTRRVIDYMDRAGPQIVEWAGFFADQLGELIDRYMPVIIDQLDDWLERGPELADTIQAGAKQVWEFLKQVKDVISPIASFVSNTTSLKGVLTALGVVMAINALASIVTFVAGVWSAVTAVGAFLVALSPITVTVAAIAGAIYLLYLAWQNNFLGIRDITWAVWEKLKEWFGEIVKWFKGFPETLTAFGQSLWEKAGWVIGKLGAGLEAAKDLARAGWNAVVNWLGQGRDQNATTFGESLRNFGRNVIGKIGEGFQSAREAAKGALTAALDWVKRGQDEKLPPFQQALFDGGKAALSRLGAGFNTVKEAAKGELKKVLDDVKEHGHAYAAGAFAGRLFEGARSALLNFGRGFSDNAPSLRNTFQTAINGLAPIFDTAIGGLQRHVYQPAADVVTRIGDGLRGIDLAGRFSSTLDTIATIFNEWKESFFEHVYLPMREIGERIMDGLARGIRDAFGRVREAFDWIVSIAPQWVKEKLGIHSPSSVFRAITKWIPPGMAEGIYETAHVVQDAMNDVMGGMMGSMAGDTTTIDNSRSNTFNVALPAAQSSPGSVNETRALVLTLSSMYG